MKLYTGIGSRETPAQVLNLMTFWAVQLNTAGYALRSGAARGADEAFEKGAGNAKEIYLPWLSFNNHSSGQVYTDAAYEMASHYHPAWQTCNYAARKLHARNCHQILGLDLETPSEFVLCYTKAGKRTGGTGQALRIASDYGIPIFDFGTMEHNRVTTIQEFIKMWVK